MRDLSADELLAVWEQGLERSSGERWLILLAAAFPDTPPEALARLPIGQGDAALLALRERTLGSRLVSQVACPACGERLELDFAVGDILVAPPTDQPPAALVLVCGSYQVRFRLPNSLDMTAIAAEGTVEAAGQRLLARCVLEAWCDDREVAVAVLPEAVRAAIAERMACEDPQADVRLALTCPACGHAWPAPFDVGAYFWEELNAWAQRLLREVHILASTYGWREADILALSPMRRRAYLEMVQG